MATQPLSAELIQQAIDALDAQNGNKTAAAKALDLPGQTFVSRIATAIARGFISEEDIAEMRRRRPTPAPVVTRAFRPAEPVTPVRAEPLADETLSTEVLARLRRGAASMSELAEALRVTPGRVLDAVIELKDAGQNIHEIGGRWSVERIVPVGSSHVGAYVSRPDGSYLFGFTGDSHLCSKYERLDVLRDLYRKFAAAGVDRVFHAGNWIDGEARFNKFDLHTHGMDRQLAYCAKEYPSVPGVSTYAIAGDDHEGWYAQREGVDVGRMLERTMRDAGREDWHNLGYMEAYVPLQHAESGKTAMLHCIHPGGGSAYATSYTVQKLVEGYESGNKPAVLLAGHYHKLEFINIRGVWTVQTGCAQDQTPFMRKKKIQVAIGGGIMRLTQNPETGAIEHAGVDLFIYFDRGYYTNQRWSHHGDVALTPRIA